MNDDYQVLLYTVHTIHMAGVIMAENNGRRYNSSGARWIYREMLIVCALYYLVYRLLKCGGGRMTCRNHCHTAELLTVYRVLWTIYYDDLSVVH